MANKTAKRRLKYHLSTLKVKDEDIVIQRLYPKDRWVTQEDIYHAHNNLKRTLKNINRDAEVITIATDVEYKALTLEQLISFRDYFNAIIESKQLKA